MSFLSGYLCPQRPIRFSWPHKYQDILIRQHNCQKAGHVLPRAVNSHDSIRYCSLTAVPSVLHIPHNKGCCPGKHLDGGL